MADQTVKTTIPSLPLANAPTPAAMTWITQDGGDFKLSLGAIIAMAANDPVLFAQIANNTATQVNQTASAYQALAAIQAALQGTLAVAGSVAASTPDQRAAASGVMFAASTASVTLTTTSASLAALVNPPGSGKNLYVQSLCVEAGVAATYVRTRTAIPVNTVLTGAATPTIVNRTGGAAKSVAQFLQVAVGIPAGGAAEKTGFAYETPALFGGTLVLPPGTALSWVAYATVSLTGLAAGAATASVEAVWWEMPI